jgi:hypothetical protein
MGTAVIPQYSMNDLSNGCRVFTSRVFATFHTTIATMNHEGFLSMRVKEKL